MMPHSLDGTNNKDLMVGYITFYNFISGTWKITHFEEMSVFAFMNFKTIFCPHVHNKTLEVLIFNL
jgi:hypothetical protein